MFYYSNILFDKNKRNIYFTKSNFVIEMLKIGIIDIFLNYIFILNNIYGN